MVLGRPVFCGFYTVMDFPPFLCGLCISVKSGLNCSRFLRDVKTEHLIIFSCIKHRFKAITFYRAVCCHIILSGLEGHVGKEACFLQFLCHTYLV